jgi:hypothetical protein
MTQRVHAHTNDKSGFHVVRTCSLSSYVKASTYKRPLSGESSINPCFAITVFPVPHRWGVIVASTVFISVFVL